MSQISTFFVPVPDGGEFQADLNAFLRGHRVLQIEKAFTGSGWAFCVEWLEGRPLFPSRSSYQRKTDYREILEPEAFERFMRMRERRKAIALEEGVPPYMVMTDAQMAEAVKDGEPTLDVLKKIDGFGVARLGKYGERLCGGEKTLNETMSDEEES